MNLNLNRSNIGLYWFLLIVTCFFVVSAVGPGLFGQTISNSSWQYKIFHLVCHQDAFRSYSVNSVSMAVCARCFGIYTALFIGLLIAPLVVNIRFLNRTRCLAFLVTSIIINFADVLANATGIYSNTLHSRFVLGALFGLSIMLFLADEFFKKITLTEDTYGTTSTA